MAIKQPANFQVYGTGSGLGVAFSGLPLPLALGFLTETKNLDGNISVYYYHRRILI